MPYRDIASPAPLLIACLRNQVFGLDPSTGAIVWEHVSQEDAPRTARIEVGDGVVYALFFCRLTCLDYLSGRMLWTVALPGAVNASILVLSDRIVVTSSGELHCVTLQGVVTWKQPFMGKGYGDFALAVPGASVQADHAG
jgi:outer membrane protein assembly factor BamB